MDKHKELFFSLVKAINIFSYKPLCLETLKTWELCKSCKELRKSMFRHVLVIDLILMSFRLTPLCYSGSISGLLCSYSSSIVDIL